jgi:hypothetical protein
MRCVLVGDSGGPRGTGSTLRHPRAEANLTALRYSSGDITPSVFARMSSAAKETCHCCFKVNSVGQSARSGRYFRIISLGIKNSAANVWAWRSTSFIPQICSPWRTKCPNSCAASNRDRALSFLSVPRTTTGRSGNGSENASTSTLASGVRSTSTPCCSNNSTTSRIGPCGSRHSFRTCRAASAGQSEFGSRSGTGWIGTSTSGNRLRRCAPKSWTTCAIARAFRRSPILVRRNDRKKPSCVSESGRPKNVTGVSSDRASSASRAADGLVAPLSNWLIAAADTPLTRANSLWLWPRSSRASLSRPGSKLASLIPQDHRGNRLPPLQSAGRRPVKAADTQVRVLAELLTEPGVEI